MSGLSKKFILALESLSRAKKLTQLSNLIGVNRTTVSRWLTGRTDVSNIDSNIKEKVILVTKKILEDIDQQKILSDYEEKQNKSVDRMISVASIAEENIVNKLLAKLEGLPHRITPQGYARKYNLNVSDQGVVQLHLSDLHLGAILQKPATAEDFNFKIAGRRLAFVIANTLRYKKKDRQNQRLVLIFNGDIVEGKLSHSFFGSEDLEDQQACVIYYLSQILGLVAAEFPRVDVYCIGGNHDRNVLVNPSRSLHNKHKNFATPVFVALSLFAQNLKNLTVHISASPFAVFPIFDYWVAATHGDTDLKLRAPNKARALNIFEHSLSQLNASKRLGVDISLLHLAHYHSPLMAPFESGIVLINGSIKPHGGYEYTEGYDGKCGQWLIHSVPEHIMGHSFFIALDKNVNDMEEMDQIIKPYNGIDCFGKE